MRVGALRTEQIPSGDDVLHVAQDFLLVVDEVGDLLFPYDRNLAGPVDAEVQVFGAEPSLLVEAVASQPQAGLTLCVRATLGHDEHILGAIAIDDQPHSIEGARHG